MKFVPQVFRRSTAYQILTLVALSSLTGWADSVCAQIHQPGQAPPIAPSSHTPHPAVCRVVVPERDGISFGSGTLIAVKGENGLVITNWHVVRDAADIIKVRFADGFESGARVLRSDRDWDLAALLIWRPNGQPVAISTAPPRPGDPLTIAGYGYGDYQTSSGRCTQYVSPGVDLPFEMVEVSVEARQGDSGGPIFNARGELAGVLFGASDGTTSGSYAGRVGQFLAAISPELGQPRPPTIAQASPPVAQSAGGTTPVPVNNAQIASLSSNQMPTTATPSVAANQAASQAANAGAAWSANNSATMNQTVFQQDQASGNSIPLNWKKFAGDNPLQWAKTAFAAIGILVVLSRLFRRSK